MLISQQKPSVVILLGIPLTEQNFERVGIQYLSKSVNIVIYDCKPLLKRTDDCSYDKAATYHNLRLINTFDQLGQALVEDQPDYAIDYIGLCPITIKIQQKITNSGAKFVIQKLGSLPIPSFWAKVLYRSRMFLYSGHRAKTTKNGLDKISGPYMRKNIFKRTYDYFKRKISCPTPDLVLLAGSESLDALTKRSKSIVWSGSLDYHTWKHRKNYDQNLIFETPYVLFVDDNLPYASDWSLLGIQSPVTPKTYYESMQHLFDQIESQWNVRVIIAAHPSSRNDCRLSEGFKGRKIIHGKTVELVRDAKAVLAHGSTAVSFAVLDEKPIMFLTSKEINNFPYGLHIRTMASELGMRPFDIDSEAKIPKPDDLVVSKCLYRQYKDRYIIRMKEAPEPSPWYNFISHILRDFENA